MHHLQLSFFAGSSVDYRKSNLAVWLTNSSYYLLLAKSELEFVALEIDRKSQRMFLTNLNQSILANKPTALFNFLESSDERKDYLYIASAEGGSCRFTLTYASEDFNYTELTALLYLNSRRFCTFLEGLDRLMVYRFSSGKFRYRRAQETSQGFQHVFESTTGEVLIWESCSSFDFPYSLANYSSKFRFHFDEHLSLEVSTLED